MQNEIKELKQQRDRFLAFAFASADLLLEINAKSEIQFASGAAKNLTGDLSSNIIGSDWLNLIAKEDRVMAISLRNQATFGQRCGPIIVNMNPEYSKTKVGILTGMKLPDYPDIFFVTISNGSYVTGKMGQENRKKSAKALLDTDSFTSAAIDAMVTAQLMGRELDITFLDFGGMDKLKGSANKDNWSNFQSEISGLLKSKSVDGQMAAEFETGRYGVLHDKGIRMDSVEEKISVLSRDIDPSGNGIHISAQTIDANTTELSEREFAKALSYSIKTFKAEGGTMELESLNKGFENFLKDNSTKITELKSVISEQKFNLAFQPIVNLKTYETHHFEALIRFDSKKSPYELITFGEDVGLAPEIDMMVTTKTINYILSDLKDRPDISIAVNLSGLSVQSTPFIKALQDKLTPYIEKEKIHERLMFEITESSQINDLEKVNDYVKGLRELGFKIWLDDFGAGAASFQYLHQLHVDGVKIDGQYIDNILASDRGGKLVKSLVRMCSDLDMQTVAERVETVQQAKFLQEIGVDFGQGFLFARPSQKPDFGTLK